MKKILIISFLFSFNVHAQQPPGTDIYLFDLVVQKDKVILSKNITNRPGYDNQPYFHPDKALIYYTSANDEGRTDLMTYDIKSETITPLTQTTEREYSPTVTPDKKFISCIIQRDDGAQNLGKYPIDGGEAFVLIDNLIVGYHAWIDDDNLLLFVLGNPLTLQRYKLSTSEASVLADSIGRSLHKIPGKRSMSFVEKKNTGWLIQAYNPENNSIQLLGTARPQHEDLCWLPDGKILMSDQDMIYSIDPAKKTSWVPIRMDKILSGKSITRIAVNTNGTKIAIVVAE